MLGSRGGDANLIREYSEQSQNYIDEEIARIMDERYKYVVKLLKQHKDLLEYIANRLVEVETMDGKEFYEIVKGEAHCKELTEKAGKSSKKSEDDNVKAKKPRTKKSENS